MLSMSASEKKLLLFTPYLKYLLTEVTKDIGLVQADRISVWLIIKAHRAQDLVLAGYL